MLFRMTRHFTEGAGLDEARAALLIAERDALKLAIDWAVAQGQTVERLHAALETYRSLPKMPTAGDVVRAEANTVENTLNLPASEVRRYLEELMFVPTTRGEADESRNVLGVGLIHLATTPWELTHAQARLSPHRGQLA